MEIIQRYKCDFCGGVYIDKYKCEECESCHRKAVKINSCEYSANVHYPKRVDIEMEDGKVITYIKVI